MDDLPILVLQEIIRFLSLPERLKCKRISKLWKPAVETSPVRFLCIHRSELPSCQLKFQSTSTMISTRFRLDGHYLDQVAKHSTNLVGHIPWTFDVDFATFYKLFKKIPKDFFRGKFAHIQDVTIIKDSGNTKTERVDPAYVLELLNQSTKRSNSGVYVR